MHACRNVANIRTLECIRICVNMVTLTAYWMCILYTQYITTKNMNKFARMGHLLFCQDVMFASFCPARMGCNQGHLPGWDVCQDGIFPRMIFAVMAVCLPEQDDDRRTYMSTNIQCNIFSYMLTINCLFYLRFN
jgi:hypothetical protein